ncbi:hypothetical protein V6N13_004661 [Hibiscus sabdariffa]|uniref:Uncharacterized protein n=1 Tax=Hibiscus sabdariffa TaxID=183260 RepID=A0ABR2RZ77_9ROSI
MQQGKENQVQSLGICHRIFNFIVNVLVGISRKRITLGHMMPQGSTNEGQQDEHARNGVRQPLISPAKLNSNSKPMERRNEFIDDDKSRVHEKTGQTYGYSYNRWFGIGKTGAYRPSVPLFSGHRQRLSPSKILIRIFRIV